MSAHCLTVTELMGQPLISIADDSSVANALLFAHLEQVHHLPIVRGSDLVGLVCTCELVAAPPSGLVSEWMSTPVLIDGRATVMDAARLMHDHEAGALIIAVEGHPRGIVTRADLLRADSSTRDVLLDPRCGGCCLGRRSSAADASSEGTAEAPAAEGSTSEPISALAAGLVAPAPVEPSLSAPSASSVHPLASLIREHELIGPLAKGLARFAEHVRTEALSPALERDDLAHFVRVFRDLADCVHHEKEEAVLLPFLCRHGFEWTEGPLAEVRSEHRQERYLIDVLCQAAARDDAWNHEERRRIVETATALAAFQAEHLCKENTLLFPAVMLRTSPAELELLEAELAAFDVSVARFMPCLELEALARALIRRYRRAATLQRDTATHDA